MKSGNNVMDCIKYKKRDEELAPDWRRHAAVVDGTQLWSTSPAVVLVQPRFNADSLDFTDTTPTLTASFDHSDIDACRYVKKKKNSSVRLLRISPNFANFLQGEDESTRRLTSERARGGYRTYPRVLEDDDLLKLRSNLKKTWNFEDIIREIESDSFRAITPPNELFAPTSPVPETFLCDDVFIEIPLQGENPVENKIESPKELERKTDESKEALSKLFDQLLADVYNHRLTPPVGVWSLDEPRRCSETKLVEIRRWEGKRIFRQLSFPGYDTEEGKRYFGASQQQMPVRSLSGINQSSPSIEEFIDFNSGSRGLGHQAESFEKLTAEELYALDVSDVEEIRGCLEKEISFAGACLVEELKEKDALLSDQEGLCEIVTAYLQAISTKTS